MRNQLEHLESLLVWSLTQSLTQLAHEGAPAAAEAEMAMAMAIERVHSKILSPVEKWREGVFDDTEVGVPEADGRACTRRAKDVARVGLVTAAGRLRAWGMQPSEEQLEEVVLFLLVWGEAANLRFMPEMLYFIYELARAHACTQGGGGFEQQAPPREFLERVVTPIYREIAEASKRNVDKDYFEHRNCTHRGSRTARC